MHGPFTALAAWILGLMALGVALSLLGLASWWAGPSRRLSLLAWLGRGALSATGIALVLIALVLLSTGTENIMGDPLRRWSGAPMVPELWFALELLARDLAWSAAHAHRSLSRALGGAVGVLSIGVWVAAKLCLVLSGYVVIWAFLQY